MTIKTYSFSVKTNYVGSDVIEDVNIEFTEEEYNNEEKREKIIEKVFDEWLWDNIETNWEEIE